ncbi:GNAT family N-acetyltransferase [Saccharicrinis aurantiacus]|uniref:GNAT family N-acetyltransferase n=1 Tax=Saccharicrinis aurantiacus TaxID=1849719 RepID=UPI0008392D46|nr:GNAT family N-acetyltransferase [Saccharicrinis aurantiacus]
MNLVKIKCFVREEGIRKLFKLLFKKLQKITISTNTTIFIRLKNTTYLQKNITNLTAKTYNIDNLPKIDFKNGRIDTRKVTEMLANGGKLFCFYNTSNQLIGYGIIRYNYVKIERDLNLNINNNYVWIGPIYVYKKYRGNGYSSKIINIILNEIAIKGHTDYYLTCINIANIASVRSFIRCGFSMFGYLIHKTTFNKKEIVYISNNGIQLDIS